MVARRRNGQFAARAKIGSLALPLASTRSDSQLENCVTAMAQPVGLRFMAGFERR